MIVCEMKDDLQNVGKLTNWLNNQDVVWLFEEVIINLTDMSKTIISLEFVFHNL